MHMTPSPTQADRAELEQMLVERRRKIQSEIDDRRRLGRADHSHEVSDMVDMSDASIEEEMSFALLEMRATMLVRIDAALARLASGEYGVCAECAEPIALGRLRALPFAVRCLDCEARVERASTEARKSLVRDGGTALMPEVRSL
jgi:DnaK suppressor protein